MASARLAAPCSRGARPCQSVLAPFDVLNPSAENIARYLFEQISGGLPMQAPVEVAEVKVWETDRASATYRP